MIRRWQRDEEYVGLVPGQVPLDTEAKTRRVRGGPEWKGTVAVQFAPPKGLSPALAGVVVDSRVNPRDLGAMMIDLALRGWFVIGRDEDDGWRFTRAEQDLDDPTSAAERVLLMGLFGASREVGLDQVKDGLAKHLPWCSDLLYDEVVARGWYGRSPRSRGPRWLTGRVPRTADGTAVRVQVLGFRQYLATAEADQIRFEDAAGLFSRYLPWAMVFGLADRWAKVVGEAVRRGQLERGLDVATAMSFDPLGWYAMDGLVDLAQLGGEGIIELTELLTDSDGLFDLGEATSALGEVFGSIVESIDLGELFNL